MTRCRLFGYDLLARTISLATGFQLIPASIGPGVTLEHVLSECAADGVDAWPVSLAVHGLDVVVALCAAPASSRAVVLDLGDYGQGGPGPAYSLMNQRRETLVNVLARPLVVMGTPKQHRRMWERAPDLWSVRSATVSLARLGTVELPCAIETVAPATLEALSRAEEGRLLEALDMYDESAMSEIERDDGASIVWAGLHVLAGNPARALALLGRLAAEHLSVSLRAVALAWAARAHSLMGAVDESERAAHEARGLLRDPLGDELVAHARRVLGALGHEASDA